MKFKDILEDDFIVECLVKRNLLKQYKKAKKFILSGYPELVNLKLRESKKAWIYYFRINKQFRAFGKIYQDRNENFLYITGIDNHQD